MMRCVLDNFLIWGVFITVMKRTCFVGGKPPQSDGTSGKHLTLKWLREKVLCSLLTTLLLLAIV